MKLTGAEIIIECLKEEGVDTIFGYPGGTVISVFDALYRNGKGIRHVLTAHEQGAAHAADGYAKATGKTGVCLVTSGPGATNLVTGIATAYMDSVPLVAITINVATSSLGKDSFQEVDIAGITMPVTKHNFIVRDASVLAHTLRRAFHIASNGRPGPVLVDITRDAAESACEYEPGFCDEAVATLIDSESVCEATGLLKGAKRPVLLVGGGAVISRASEEIRRLLSLADIPVTDTLMGKGVVPGDDPHYLGMCGIYGTYAANKALRESDLIIAVGCRFSERVTGVYRSFAPRAKIVQIDIDRAELDKNVRITLGICGDAAACVHMLNENLAGRGRLHAIRYPEWSRYIGGLKKTHATSVSHSRKKLDGPLIVDRVFKATKGDAIITTEVGLNQMWAATYFNYSYPGQLLTSGGLGTMGYGLGAAIGAQIGHPDKLVINIAGDGCFRMNMNELITAASERLPIIEVVIDNGTLGMVHDMQKSDYEGRYCDTEFKLIPDYAAASEALGARSIRVSNVSELDRALADAIASRQLSVIVCTARRS